MPVLPEFSLAGRVAVLSTTGGDQAPLLAQCLAEAGASVFAIARRPQLLDQVMEALDAHSKGKASNAGHGGTVASLSDPAEVQRAMAELDASFDRVDILVNDARSMLAKPFADISPEEWDEVLSRNAKATFLLCQAIGPRMVDRGYGRIVNLISVLAFAASQAALLSLTRSMAVEWGRHNIRVNALGAGWFTNEDLSPEEQQQELLVRYTPLRRKGHPRDIGPLLVYLCSESCDYSTGQPVYVDGGLNAHP